MTQI